MNPTHYGVKSVDRNGFERSLESKSHFDIAKVTISGYEVPKS